jgi:hypothetical protein
MKGLLCAREVEAHAPGGKENEVLLLPFGQPEPCVLLLA